MDSGRYIDPDSEWPQSDRSLALLKFKIMQDGILNDAYAEYDRREQAAADGIERVLLDGAL